MLRNEIKFQTRLPRTYVDAEEDDESAAHHPATISHREAPALSSYTTAAMHTLLATPYVRYSRGERHARVHSQQRVQGAEQRVEERRLGQREFAVAQPVKQRHLQRRVTICSAQGTVPTRQRFVTSYLRRSHAAVAFQSERRGRRLPVRQAGMGVTK